MSLPLRIAVIDLGTNSVRFDVHELCDNGKTKLIHREKMMVRLGENVFVTGKLDEKAVSRTLQALSEFRQTAEEIGARRYIAFGTSALREAIDSQRVVDRIRRQTKIPLKVISGREEARLIAHAILRREGNTKGVFGLVDIGGGSTEMSICKKGRVAASESFPLGAARIQQIFLKSIPPAEHKKEVASVLKPLQNHIRATFAKIHDDDWPVPQRIIGSSGTVRALSKIMRRTRGTRFIEEPHLERLIKEMSLMTPSELLAIPGMEPKRVDLILAGSVLLLGCMQALRCEVVEPTELSLRDGILDDELENVSPRSLHRRLGIDDVATHVGKMLGDPRRTFGRMQLAQDLFDVTKSLHRLSREWRVPFILACLLKETGKIVSRIAHEEHSAYIAEHIDLPLAEGWERDIVAELCRYHDNSRQDEQPEPVFASGSRTLIKPFFKLLALIRIVDAFEKSPTYPPIKRCINLRSKSVEVRIPRAPNAELTALRLHQRKELFEKIFSRVLLVSPK